MRGNRQCGSCQWFEDHSEDFRSRFVPFHGFCHWRMPATVAKDSQGWGSWHQKGPASVRKEDWCSCWHASVEIRLENGAKQIEAGATPALTNGQLGGEK